MWGDIVGIYIIFGAVILIIVLLLLQYVRLCMSRDVSPSEEEYQEYLAFIDGYKEKKAAKKNRGRDNSWKKSQNSKENTTF